jgi:hypothetical protein
MILKMITGEILPQNISYKCGDKEAPVTTFVPNAFFYCWTPLL